MKMTELREKEINRSIE